MYVVWLVDLIYVMYKGRSGLCYLTSGFDDCYLEGRYGIW